MKDEARKIAIAVLTGIFVLKICFYKEETFKIAIIMASLLWLFAIPGYCMLLRLRDKIGLMERAVLGFILGIAVYGIASYNLGILGINVGYHASIIPAVEIIFSLAVLKIKK